MDRRAARETWTKRVERWKDSGLSGTEFAQELGVSVKSLRWWRWRLASEAAPGVAAQHVTEATAAARAPKPAATRKRQRHARKAPPSVTFIEMPSAPIAPSTPIEIVFSARLHVRVAAGFDDVTLARVLDVLERRS